MIQLSDPQLAQLFYQAGFRGEDLVTMVAISKRESGGRADAWRSNNPNAITGDFGLTQINYVNLKQLAPLGITDMRQLLDPVKNAQAAFFLFQKGGFSPWKASVAGFNASGSHLYGINLNKARTAVNDASIRGMFNQPFQLSDESGQPISYDVGTLRPTHGSAAGGSSTAPNASGLGSAGSQYPQGPTAPSAGYTPPTSPTAGPGGSPAGGGYTMSNVTAAAAGPFNLPSDAKLYNNGFTVVAVFDVGGVKIGYDIDWTANQVNFDPNAVESISPDQWAQLGVVNGGNAEELRGFQYGTYVEFWNTILDSVIGKNNPARTDPGVLAVIAEYAGRPDMSEVELQNKLQGTTWFQTRTSGELVWNGLSDAEKTLKRSEMASKMASTWFDMAGVVVSPDDPRIQNYLEDIASGRLGYGSWTENIVKRAASDNPESPWSRSVRDEQESQRQRGVDVENTAQRIKTLAGRWGLQWSEQTYQDFARKITEKTMSDADVLEEMKNQAQVLYPWKSREMETMTAATPWLETYRRVLEKEADLTSPQVQAALTAGQPVFEFEKQLKKSGEWLGTKNGREAVTSSIGAVGRLMGFA